MRSVRSADIEGVTATLLIVETITASICAGSMPAFSIASRDAVSARSIASTPLLARFRVMIPVR
jgi:hypothetical protein